ncbi:SDR family NAD(P)-dependent oxidoreductase [Streptomyces cyaneofuscatus]|uniref:SDR family NAD(P)-dependent oxidoreductase n=1 Tax=Streptomyces cyaneofuscatus TaxID=66883 RepID=UPI003F4BF3C0
MTDRKRILSGRTAVVTGGARGLGKAIAKELAARGVNVALLGLEGGALGSLRRDDLATGARAVRMPYIDQRKSVANELKYGDKVHLQND